MGRLDANGSTTPCPLGVRLPHTDARISGPCLLELDHGLTANAWELTLRAFAHERKSAKCSADDPWDHGISEPNKLLQALFGITYDAEQGGGISGARCKACHKYQSPKANYRIGLNPHASHDSDVDE